jgi:hypothetical protein
MQFKRLVVLSCIAILAIAFSAAPAAADYGSGYGGGYNHDGWCDSTGNGYAGDDCSNNDSWSHHSSYNRHDGDWCDSTGDGYAGNDCNYSWSRHHDYGKGDGYGYRHDCDSTGDGNAWNDCDYDYDYKWGHHYGYGGGYGGGYAPKGGVDAGAGSTAGPEAISATDPNVVMIGLGAMALLAAVGIGSIAIQRRGNQS